MNNFIKARDWLRLALIEIEEAVDLKEKERLSGTVFHLQQSLEKGCKAIISFLGIEAKYTHFPGQEIIKKEILENQDETKRLSLTKKHIFLLEKIVQACIPLEDERTKPRYGKEYSDRIVLPTEIYTKERSEFFFKSGYNFWKNVREFFENFRIEEINKVLEKIDAQTEKLK